MRAIIGVVGVLILSTGCATAPKPESQWRDWDDIKPGASQETVKRIMGEPAHTGTGHGQEFWVWQNCGVRFQGGKLQGKTCGGDEAQWDKVVEGSSKIEVAYYVGLSLNQEAIPGGKRYYYQPGTYTHCTLTIADDTQLVTGRVCETDMGAQRAARAQAMQNFQRSYQNQNNYQVPAIQNTRPVETTCTSGVLGNGVQTNCTTR